MSAAESAIPVIPSQTHKPLTAPEKAFWKDAFVACAKSILLRDNGSSPEATADLCANFADAAMDAYRSRSITWRQP
jgi:hypothetical protein